MYGPCRQGVQDIITCMWFTLNALPRPYCRYIYGLDEASQDQLEQQQRAIVGRCGSGDNQCAAEHGHPDSAPLFIPPSLPIPPHLCRWLERSNPPMPRVAFSALVQNRRQDFKLSQVGRQGGQGYHIRSGRAGSSEESILIG